jgi:hypothetical protein
MIITVVKRYKKLKAFLVIISFIPFLNMAYGIIVIIFFIFSIIAHNINKIRRKYRYHLFLKGKKK